MKISWLKELNISLPGVSRPGGGGVLLGILGGCVSPGSPNPSPYFRPKNVIFHTCFQTRPLKSIPVLRAGLKAEIISLLR